MRHTITAVETSCGTPDHEPLHAQVDRRVHDEGRAESCRLVVWGTGRCAQEFVAHLRPEIDVVAFVDGNASRWGAVLGGDSRHERRRAVRAMARRLQACTAYSG